MNCIHDGEDREEGSPFIIGFGFKRGELIYYPKYDGLQSQHFHDTGLCTLGKPWILEQ